MVKTSNVQAFGGKVKSGKRADLDNQFFRSAWEANYARLLNFYKEQGLIRSWEYEVDEFEFYGIRKGTRFYKPDFKVTDNDGSVKYVEIKGWKHQKGEVALRRMKKYYPDIVIDVIDAKRFRHIAKQVSKIIPNWE